MPKADKQKLNVKERVEENVCDLSLSELMEVPVREIAAFKRVNVLDLSSNKLLTLGKSFTNLTRIVKLDLSKNQIKYLPEDFGLLRNLRHLDLYNNKLEHLPLSFGELSNLRYLDLKGNPLTPALAKIVGFCLTSKDCQDAARNTVKFLSLMQVEAEKAKEKFRQLELFKRIEYADYAEYTDESTPTSDGKPVESQNQNKAQKAAGSKKQKAKNKKSNSNNNNNHVQTKEQQAAPTIAKTSAAKNAKAKKTAMRKLSNRSTALTSVFTFFMLLAINILVIYMIMFKNPEIADKLVELIPQQYRDWILTKTEFFRLRVSDWISEFRTPPEEH